MESLQHLKKRLKSVGNIKKITKAMELVAATKMRKSQEIALASRPYALAALDLLANLSRLQNPLPPLFLSRKIEKVLFVLVASDKGLAGAFNSSLFRKFEQHVKTFEEKYAGEEKVFVAVGEKSFTYLSKRGFKPLKKFTNVGDFTTVEQVQPLAEFIVEGFLKKDFDRVVIFSTHFKSALKQEALVRRVLPVDMEHIKETVQEIIPEKGKFAELIEEHGLEFGALTPDKKEYTVEPAPQLVLENLAKHLLLMQVYHLILEANASEHAARRMAMKTASDNASDLVQDLHLEYNKSRQAAITSQIIEISAGAEALS